MFLIRNLANLLTLGNLFAGCLAIIYLFFDHMIIETSNGIRGKEVQVFMDQLDIACYLIFIGLGLDFLDGFVARLMGTNSEIGKQLDSLADVVTFGVVPGLIFYNLLANAFAHQTNAIGMNVMAFIPALAIPIFAAIRLARFNVEDDSSGDFRGLATPAVGIIAASLPLGILTDLSGLSAFLVKPAILYALIAALCLLMVSTIKMPSLKLSAEGKTQKLVVFGLSVVAGLVFLFVLKAGFLALTAVVLTYIIVSIINDLIIS